MYQGTGHTADTTHAPHTAPSRRNETIREIERKVIKEIPQPERERVEVKLRRK